VKSVNCIDPEIKKANEEVCKNCVEGEGCKIYDTRPPICRGFKCLWLAEEQIPDNLRPDRCKIMIEPPSRGSISFLAYSEPGNKDAWKNKSFLILVGKILEMGHPVVLYRGKGIPNHYFLPKGMNPKEVTRDITELYRKTMEKSVRAEDLELKTDKEKILLISHSSTWFIEIFRLAAV